MKSKSLYSIFAMSILMLLAALVVTKTFSYESAEDAITRVENQYHISLDITPISAYSDRKKVRLIHDTERLLALLSQELHDALVSHFSASGQNITIVFAEESDEAFGMYDERNATITLFGDTTSLCHEYGHMLFHALSGKYGDIKFEKDWVAINDGVIPYDLEEDIASAFGLYTEAYVGKSVMMKNSQIFKKAMLIEKTAKKVFGINKIYSAS